MFSRLSLRLNIVAPSQMHIPNAQVGVEAKNILVEVK